MSRCDEHATCELLMIVRTAAVAREGVREASTMVAVIRGKWSREVSWKEFVCVLKIKVINVRMGILFFADYIIGSTITVAPLSPPIIRRPKSLREHSRTSMRERDVN